MVGIMCIAIYGRAFLQRHNESMLSKLCDQSIVYVCLWV